MKLQTYDDCMGSMDLLVVYSGGNDGMFFVEYDDGGFSFRWFADGWFHRVDGPAYITLDRREWWFDGEQVHVDNQEEFEAWLVRNVRI